MAPVFTAMGLPAPSAVDLLDQLAKEEAAKVNTLKAGLNRESTRRHERTLLRDERGSAYGEVKAEIPMDLYMNLHAQKQFGPAALSTPEGIKEVLKAYPQCGVKTVGLKHAHTHQGRENFRRINWGGRMQFAT